MTHRLTRILPLALLTLVAALAGPGSANALPPTCDDDPSACSWVENGDRTLTVTRTAGTITAVGINCGSDCTDHQPVSRSCEVGGGCSDWPDSTVWTLSASGGPAGYSAVWTGCGRAPTCAVPLGDASTGDDSATVHLTWVDTTQPSASFSPPAKVGPSNYTVAASASDNSGAIASYTWWVDDVQQGATGSSLSLSAIASGSHTVKVRALDVAGNASAVVAKTVAIDRSVNVTPGTLPAITRAATAPLSFTTDADVVTRKCSVNNGTAVDLHERLVGHLRRLGRRLLRLPRDRHRRRRQHQDERRADRDRRPHAARGRLHRRPDRGPAGRHPQRRDHVHARRHEPGHGRVPPGRRGQAVHGGLRRVAGRARRRPALVRRQGGRRGRQRADRHAHVRGPRAGHRAGPGQRARPGHGRHPHGRRHADTGGGTTTTGGGGTPTTTGGGATPRKKFDPLITGAYGYNAKKTWFTLLRVRGLPADAKVVVSCKGKGCSLKSKKVAHKGGTVNLLKTLKKLTVRPGGTVQVRITAADGRVKIARWTARKKKTAKFAAGCVGAGGKLAAC